MMREKVEDKIEENITSWKAERQTWIKTFRIVGWKIFQHGKWS